MKQALEHRFEFLLQDWIEHNTFTKNHEGVKSFLVKVKEELDSLGLKTEWHLPQATANSLKLPSVLVGILPSTHERSTGAVITLVACADTIVSPDSEFSGLTWSSDHKRAIGPGVLHNKGGVMTALFVLETLVLMETRNFTVQFLCIPNSEEGSAGFTKVFEKLSYKSQAVIGLLPPSQNGSIYHSRRGMRNYEIVMEKNLELMITKLAQLLEFATQIPGAALKVQELKSGRTNSALIYTTFETIVDRDELHQRISNEFKDADINLLSDCPVLPIDPKGVEFQKKALKLLNLIEVKPTKLESSTTASPANYLYRPGLIVIDGLGPTGEGHKTNSESIEVNSFFTRSKVMLELIDWISRQK